MLINQISDAKFLIEENRQLKDQQLCKICLDFNASIAFLPCGHLVCCSDCAPAMRKCPICRGHVKGTVKTFMVWTVIKFTFIFFKYDNQKPTNRRRIYSTMAIRKQDNRTNNDLQINVREYRRGKQNGQSRETVKIGYTNNQWSTNKR